MKVRALAAVVVLTTVLLGLTAAPAQAATSQGCSGSISAVNGQGDPIDTLTLPSTGGTPTSPFRFLWGEPISWTGQTTEPVTTGSWHISVEHPSWLFELGQLMTGHHHGLTGTFTAGTGATTYTSSFTPSAVEGVTLPGRFDVAFAVTGAGGVQCTATLSVQVLDSPFRNPLFWLSVLLVAAGLVLLFFFGFLKVARPVYVRGNEPRRVSRHLVVDTIAGLFLGVGFSLLATLYGSSGWSTTTPNLIIVVGVIVGLLIGLVPTATTRSGGRR